VPDDLLKPEEIEALLKAAGAGGPSGDQKAAGGPPPQQSRGATAGGDFANQLKAAARSGSAAPRDETKPRSPTERLLEQAEAGLAAAIAPNLHSSTGIPQDLGNASPFQFQSFEPAAGAGGDGVGLNALQEVELDLRIELGRTELLIDEVLQLREGSVVPLNKLAGDPVDILVNGRLIARGEVLVLNDNFCVRIAEIVAPTL
jgi:flagellar motor switch protein FliN/FliY